MANIVTVRGEGGVVFDLDLDLNPGMAQFIASGRLTVLDEAYDAAPAGDDPAGAADAAAPKPARKPRAKRTSAQK